MRSVKNFTLAVTSLALLLSLISCSPSAPYHEPDYTFPEPVKAVATDIMLEVRTMWGSFIIDTILLTRAGEITFDTSVAWGTNAFEIYASTEGFYTQVYYCYIGQTITIGLDKIPKAKNAMTGVIIGMQGWSNDHYVNEGTLVLTHRESGFVDTSTTDAQGRWGIQNAPLGTYDIELSIFNQFGYLRESVRFVVSNSQGVDYFDLTYWDDVQADAPNIYLYPETTTDISVSISFPTGGQIILSEPPYNNGWNVNVTPEGLIDDQYNYLFYEARLTMPLQIEYGWLLDGNNLESDLRQLLHNFGFRGREIDDFIDFWLPKISGFPWYAMSPQPPEQMNLLHIDPRPDNLLRGLFTIRPLVRPINLITPPENQSFERDRFTVVEWGVIDWVRPTSSR